MAPFGSLCPTWRAVLLLDGFLPLVRTTFRILLVGSRYGQTQRLQIRHLILLPTSLILTQIHSPLASALLSAASIFGFGSPTIAKLNSMKISFSNCGKS